MEQVTVVKGAYSGYCLRLIQTDFMNPENRKIFSTRLSCFCSFQSENSFPLFSVLKKVLNRMAHEYADDDPQASEYAGKDPPDDSDNDEGLDVETNANVITAR